MGTLYILVYYYNDEPHELDASKDRAKMEDKAKYFNDLLRIYGLYSSTRYHEVQEDVR